MKQTKYDIFISYRRDRGAQYARTLQLMLEKRGYRVFLDYDELVDEEFSPQIEAAIKAAPIYIILLTKGALDRCANEGDWVRRELETALNSGRKIIPVNPDGTFDGLPDGLTERIKNAIEGIQQSEVNFGQTLNATVDLLVKNRIKPHVKKHGKRIAVGLAIAALALIVGGLWIQSHMRTQRMEKLKEEITFDGQPLSWADDINEVQLLAVGDVLQSMRKIEGGQFMQGAEAGADGEYDENVEPEFEAPAFSQTVATFYISQFEVSVGQWNAVMGDNREDDPAEPVANVTYFQAKEFIDRLNNLTLLDFRLPTEAEWEYAARGGSNMDKYAFAGGDELAEVAWYAENSGGKAHANLLSTPTSDDLFNMSGNVSEWCETPFRPYDGSVEINDTTLRVVRGGNFDSSEYELTVTHREPAAPETSIPTLGFRLAMTK